MTTITLINTMADYSKGKIYKIFCNETGLQYFGSTTESLKMRLCKHVDLYNRFKAGKHKGNCSVNKVLENGDYQIMLIEEVPCDTKWQLLRREAYYIKVLECVNANVPRGSTQERNKAYREKNKVKIAATKSIKHDCVCGGHYTSSNKSQHIKKSHLHQAYIIGLEQQEV